MPNISSSTPSRCEVLLNQVQRWFHACLDSICAILSLALGEEIPNIFHRFISVQCASGLPPLPDLGGLLDVFEDCCPVDALLSKDRRPE